MRKLVAVTIIIAMLMVQMAPEVVSAGSADARTALEQLNKLDESSKGMLLSKIWDLVVEEIGNGKEVEVDSLYEAMKAELKKIQNPKDSNKNMWESVIAETGNTGNDGKISGDSLRIIIGKLINNKQIVIDYYNTFKQFVDKDFAKRFFGLPNTATSGEVFMKLIPLLKEVVTQDEAGKFVRYGDVKSKIAAKIGINHELLDLFLGIDVNKQMDEYIARLNNYIGDGPGKVTVRDAIFILELYNLFAPRSTGGGGGVDITPTEDSKKDIKDMDDILKQLDGIVSESKSTEEMASSAAQLAESAAELIEKLEDSEEALKITEKIILSAESVLKAAEKQGLFAADLNRALRAMAGKVMDKVAKVAVAPTASDDGMKAVLALEEADKPDVAMDDIVRFASALNQALANSKVDGKVEAVLEIELDYKPVPNASTFEMPGWILKAAVEKKLDRISINTGIATVSIVPDVRLSGEVIRLETRQVDTGTLPENIKALAANNAVYDFSLTVDGNAPDKFNKAVKVSIPYALKENENPGKLTVFYINENGEPENVIGVYNEETKTVGFAVKHFGKYVIKANEVAFNDLDSVKWAKDGIEVMAAKGIVKGIGNNKFEPLSNVTRAQFVTMIVRALNLYDDEAESNFADVDEDYLFYREISSAFNAGIVQGTPEGKFFPGEFITRQDAAIMISNALISIKEKAIPEDPDAYISRYVDRNNISKYAQNAAALCTKYSILLGNDKGEYDPKGYTTRAAAALIIYRMFSIR